jgi:hypothetical protein
MDTSFRRIEPFNDSIRQFSAMAGIGYLTPPKRRARPIGVVNVAALMAPTYLLE